MGMLAFIINVGLFVKAKINLQNAVDAAAFSGAAVQARQLTNMANVNWEMRNTYKEWMFKYYVLGQLGLMKENPPPAFNLADSVLSGTTPVSFLLRNVSSAGSVGAGGIAVDTLNMASICVHNNSTHNICPIFTLPGIPRFPAVGIVGISDVHEAFVNKLVERKGENCSERTQVNFLAALSWAYSSGIKETPGSPMLATNRPGAWPETIELAMRMRNLEMIMNRPAVADIDFVNKDSLSQSGADIGLNERPVKAFMSAFRNLGGGKYKDRLAKSDGGTAYDELAKSFKLTEISPRPYDVPAKTVSGFLIPQSFSYPDGGSALSKAYVDMQAVPINYAPIFSTFATMSNTNNADNIVSEATCGVSKTAMPVPGYIMGFIKNPRVLTYYAVKGEADFTGLFFPSSPASPARSFKLTAYAAAKPFGGRIGPKLFSFPAGDASVRARDDVNRRSSSYISGVSLNFATSGGSGPTSVTFKPGDPIPPYQDFWVNGTNLTIGGIPDVSSNEMAFGIPNIIYDFRTINDLEDQSSGMGGNLQMVVKGTSSTLNRGLYNPYQMRTLKAALGTSLQDGSMSSNDLMSSLVRARQVTKYDAANYLIPDLNRGNSTNAAPTVKPEAEAVPGGVGVYYKIYAPLIGDQLLYRTSNQVEDIVGDYMSSNQRAVDLFLESLLKVANSILVMKDKDGKITPVNETAAKTIHINASQGPTSKTPLPLVSADPNDPTDPQCAKDMASKYSHFFTADSTQCGVVPLKVLMVEYINKKSQGDGRLMYQATYLNTLDSNAVMTAYNPGPRHGAELSREAMAVGPIGTTTSSYSTRRNFYSTKFIPLAKVLADATPERGYTEDVYLESDSTSPDDVKNLIIQNLIPADGTSGLNNSFFKDF